MDTITSITAGLHAKNERTERELQSTKRRIEKTENATRELHESVAELRRLVGEAEAVSYTHLRAHETGAYL
eukprot:158919-Pyramimonas_sp.AAC.1